MTEPIDWWSELDPEVLISALAPDLESARRSLMRALRSERLLRLTVQMLLGLDQARPERRPRAPELPPPLPDPLVEKERRRQ
jgi:hypothetical protein